MNLEVIILAAGQGTRMRSALPKVLHPVGGSAMLQRVIDAARLLQPRAVHVVVGKGADQVRAEIGDQVSWSEQAQQLGTCHAVAQAMPAVDPSSAVLVLYGDVPLVNPQTLQRCVDAVDANALSLVTADFANPAQLGRIVRRDGSIVRIVEYKDAGPAERAITEINSGILAGTHSLLKELMDQVGNDNAQSEYYLTDVVGLAVASGRRVDGVLAENEIEVAGVNDRVQLAEVERAWQQQEADRLMREGVTLADPARLDVRGQVHAEQDCFIDANVVLQGEVRLGRNVSIGSGVVIIDSTIGDNVRIEANTVIEGAVVAANCSLGPFARVRPGSDFAEGVKIGNFVETKKAKLGEGSKASHLTYLGDATIGRDCNIGAGTVTCNYDGVNKHPTTIGDEVFVGTNSTLVAPVDIGDQSYVGAGSTITHKVGAQDLAVGRSKQRNIKGWTPPAKRRKS